MYASQCAGAGTQLSTNMEKFFRNAIRLAFQETKPNSVADQYIHQKIGQNVSYAGLRVCGAGLHVVARGLQTLE